ncbi:Colicin-E5 Imm protein [Paraburkholderia fungorum]|uniref:Colicin-E5 Imm protein n=1 Tax=Paraburkholderia fungorum TaxID=134537 RepID=A0A1H1JHI4_9BURK|nr:colicin immunity protein [Paraburkholderia fungorum]SDR49199.1 Colicin-E5 Imm protein [Paraburkholderia fungorum]
MNIDLQRLYVSPNDFFELGGSVVMKVSAEAAVAIFISAAEHGLGVARVEGGIWHAPGFKARSDCIWDGADPPVSQDVAEVKNLAAPNSYKRNNRSMKSSS